MSVRVVGERYIYVPRVVGTARVVGEIVVTLGGW